MTGTIDPATRLVIEQLNRSLKEADDRHAAIRATLDLQNGEYRHLDPPSATPPKGNRAARRAARRRDA